MARPPTEAAFGTTTRGAAPGDAGLQDVLTSDLYKSRMPMALSSALLAQFILVEAGLFQFGAHVN
jgi:hypothetical protein